MVKLSVGKSGTVCWGIPPRAKCFVGTSDGEAQLSVSLMGLWEGDWRCEAGLLILCEGECLSMDRLLSVCFVPCLEVEILGRVENNLDIVFLAPLSNALFPTPAEFWVHDGAISLSVGDLVNLGATFSFLGFERRFQLHVW